MRRIVIFGNSGSGKSTFAKYLAKKHKLAHLDLDTLAWLPTDPPTRKIIRIVQQDIREFIRKNKDWVIEGCYSDLLECLLPTCNELYFLNLPVELCIENAKKRPWEPHKYESKSKQDENLEMLLDWINQYPERQDTFSQTAHLALFNKFRGTKHMHVKNIELKPYKQR